MTLGAPFAFLGVGVFAALGLYGVACDARNWWDRRCERAREQAQILTRLDALELAREEAGFFAHELVDVWALPTVEPRRVLR